MGNNPRTLDCRGLSQGVCSPVHKPGWFYLSVYFYPPFFFVREDCAVAAGLCRVSTAVSFSPTFTTKVLPGETSPHGFARRAGWEKFTDSQLKSLENIFDFHQPWWQRAAMDLLCCGCCTLVRLPVVKPLSK